MARLYADEQFPFAVIKGLREIGHDVLTVQDANQAGLKIPDSDVLNFATENNRNLFFNKVALKKIKGYHL
jgi:hypothetical protein